MEKIDLTLTLLSSIFTLVANIVGMILTAILLFRWYRGKTKYMHINELVMYIFILIILIIL